MKARKFWYAISTSILLAGILAVLGVCKILVDRAGAEVRYRAEIEGEHVATEFRTGILSALDNLNRLGEWWTSEGRALDREEWQSDTRIFLGAVPGLREVFWVRPDGIIAWSAKPGADPQTRRAPAPPEMQAALAAVKVRHSPAIHVVDAPSPGFYACGPIADSRGLRGYIVGLFDAESLAGSIARAGQDRGHRIMVTAHGRRIFASTPLEGRNVVRRSIRFGNESWDLALVVPRRYYGEFKTLILVLIIVVACLLYAGGMLLYVRAKSEARVRSLNRDLRRRVEEFRQLLDVTPIGIAVAEDPECRNIWMNPALARMMGVPPSMNISKSGPNADSLPYRFEIAGREIPPEELPMQRVAATGMRIADYEHEIVRGDGKVLSVIDFASPLFDEDGEVRGVINACVDISERKVHENEHRRLMELQKQAHVEAGRALAALRESEAKFQHLIESDVLGIMIAGPDRILDANGFFLDLIGYSRDELLELSWRDITPESYRSADEFYLQHLLATGQLPAVEKEFLHKNGDPVPVLIGGALLENGPEGKAICFILNLTVRRDLERRLQRAESMQSLGVMAAGIAHDFNSMLTAVIGNASLAMDATPRQSEACHYLGQVLEAGERMAAVVRKVLAYTGCGFHTVEPLDVGSAVAAVRPELARLVEGKADLQVAIDPDLPPIRADFSEFQQVLASAVTNSVEAIEGHGTIRIAVSLSELDASEAATTLPLEEIAPGQYVRIEIADDGCGMPADVAAKAFDPFFTTKFVGRGLGLAAVLGIMRSHHGQVRVQSSPDGGTRLELFFPGATDGVEPRVAEAVF